MKTQFIIISLLLLGFTARAQQPYLSREAYRDKVEAYSQILKQQKLKTMASAEARKIAHTGFLPKIDVNADGTLNMSDLKAWNGPDSLSERCCLLECLRFTSYVTVSRQISKHCQTAI